MQDGPRARIALQAHQLRDQAVADQGRVTALAAIGGCSGLGTVQYRLHQSRKHALRNTRHIAQQHEHAGGIGGQRSRARRQRHPHPLRIVRCMNHCQARRLASLLGMLIGDQRHIIGVCSRDHDDTAHWCSQSRKERCIQQNAVAIGGQKFAATKPAAAAGC